eukprot:16189756-Heterocapsa_arctica.AAC.1
MVDRLIHQDVLSFVAKDEGTLADGLKWYLNDGRSHNLWSLLDAQVETMPDRGSERPPAPFKRKYDAITDGGKNGLDHDKCFQWSMADHFRP